MLRRLSILSVLLVVILTPTALAANVKIRVEGKTTTIFGPAQPGVVAGNALQALDAASFAGEFYVAPVYNELILSGKRVGIFPIDGAVMHGLGTPEEVARFEARALRDRDASATC